MTTSREFKELGNQTSTGILLVRESLLVPPGGIPAGSTTVTADPATIVGDGGATPLGVVGAGANAGQFQTNANGVRVKTKQGAAGNAEIYAFAGDPNGVFAADQGSIVLDITNAKIWVNTTGAMVWVQVGGGAAQKMFDVAMATTIFSAGGNENDVNFGGLALGLTTYAPFQSSINEHITGISNNGAPMAAGDDGKVICIVNVGVNAVFVNPQSALSVASNRLTTTGGGVTSMAAGGAYWFRYDGGALRWRNIAATNQAA